MCTLVPGYERFLIDMIIIIVIIIFHVQIKSGTVYTTTCVNDSGWEVWRILKFDPY